MAFRPKQMLKFPTPTAKQLGETLKNIPPLLGTPHEMLHMYQRESNSGYRAVRLLIWENAYER
jgi:hypothetical protein